MNKQIIALTFLAVAIFGTTSLLLTQHKTDFELADGTCAALSAKSGKFFVTNSCDHNVKITVSQPGVDYDKTFTTDCLTPKAGQLSTLASGRSYSVVSEVAC